jgi:hypothetical protein
MVILAKETLRWGDSARSTAAMVKNASNVASHAPAVDAAARSTMCAWLRRGSGRYKQPGLVDRLQALRRSGRRAWRTPDHFTY